MDRISQTVLPVALVMCILLTCRATALPITINTLQTFKVGVSSKAGMDASAMKLPTLLGLKHRGDSEDDLSSRAQTSKRDQWSLVQNTALRTRTVGRLRWPCAGVEPKLDVGLQSALTRLTPGPATSGMLTSLQREAQGAEEATRALFGLYPELHLSDVRPDHFRLVVFPLPELSHGDMSVPEVVGRTYREVARAVLVLELLIGQQTSPALTNGMEALKEVRLFNLLCGLQVVMDTRHVVLSARAAADIWRSEVEAIPNTAFRYARDLHQMANIAAMLARTADILASLAQHLR